MDSVAYVVEWHSLGTFDSVQPGPGRVCPPVLHAVSCAFARRGCAEAHRSGAADLIRS